MNKPRNIDEQINEALGGIASPGDVQPKEAISRFMRALDAAGLIGSLKNQGVEWKTPDDHHQIVFSKAGVKLLQQDYLSLADPATVSALLVQLYSVARGNAPQAIPLEIDRLKREMDKLKDIESKMREIADQHTGLNDPIND